MLQALVVGVNEELEFGIARHRAHAEVGRADDGHARQLRSARIEPQAFGVKRYMRTFQITMSNYNYVHRVVVVSFALRASYSSRLADTRAA